MTNEMNKWDRECMEKCEKLIDNWGVIANGSRAVMPKFLMKAFRRQHRTLQQSIVASFVQMLIEWRKGEKGDNVDLRNENAWIFAGTINEQTYFPFI